MDQTRQGMRSTAVAADVYIESDDDRHPKPVLRTSKRAVAYTKVIPLHQMRHTDLTGRFPIPEKSGAQFVMVMSS